ncbi:hypothetical protein ACP70R_012956 [Stipagrostis hirtigluma subsp. patula]
MNAEGCIESFCEDVSGFPEILWEALKKFGYTDRPLYRGREFVENGIFKCRVVLHVSHCPEHPDWKPWTVGAVGAMFHDTCRAAACQALHTFCQEREEEVEKSVIRFFPPSNPHRPTWVNRVKASESIEDPTVVAMTKYALAQDYLRDLYHLEWRLCISRAEQAETEARDLREQLEQARERARIAEDLAERTMRGWQKSINYYLQKLNRCEAKLAAAYGRDPITHTTRRNTFYLPPGRDGNGDPLPSPGIPEYEEDIPSHSGDEMHEDVDSCA